MIVENPVLSFRLDVNDLMLDEKEVLRYMGYNKINVNPEDIEPVRNTIAKARPFISPKACYRKFDIELKEDGRIVMPYGELISRDLSKNLNGCNSVYIMAATIGPQFDRELKKLYLRSMAEAAYMQAVGAAAVENLTDQLNAYIKKLETESGNMVKPRYSPGFGDYTLDNQIGIFKVLDPFKMTGITLMDTLIMSPEKSVTAIIGVFKGA